MDSLLNLLTPASLMGLSGWEVLLLLFFATFISEDLACVGAGLLVASGELNMGLGILACALGIWSGDMLLYAIGRAGRGGMVQTGWLNHWVSAEKMREGERLLAEKGTLFLLATRFLPGARLPSYVAAGALRYPVTKMMLVLALAVVVWTPLLCVLTLTYGKAVLPWLHEGRLWVVLPTGWFLLAMALNLGPKLFSWRGRRLLYSKWQRFRRWEFWPSWAFYAPVVPWILWLTVRHRSLTVATLCNPAIPLSGLAMESKSAILSALGDQNSHRESIAAWTLLPPGPPEDRLVSLHRFMEEQKLEYPVVLKPDVGERGQGVAIIHAAAAAQRYLTACQQLVIAQRYVGGREFGVFYIRQPGAACGEIVSLAEKHLFSVRGDGQHTLEELVLAHPRAVAMAAYYERKWAHRYRGIPSLGEVVQLADIGTHCRGAIFTDARKHLTEALCQAVDELTRPFQGFHYGRYDLRVPTLEDLKAGRSLQVLELNGLTAEPVHIYDPNYSLWQAWCDVCAGWSAAFAAGAKVRAAGQSVPSLPDVLAALRQHRRHAWFEADRLQALPFSHD